MDRINVATAVFKTGRVLSYVVLLLLVAATVYAGVIATMNWSAIGV